MPFDVVTLSTVRTRGEGPVGETIDTPRHRALGTESRVAILNLVRATDGGMTAGQVGERTGLHLSTVRAHLDRLVEAGLLVKARASGGSPGRPAWRYRPTGDGDAAPAPAPYRALAAALLDHLAGGGGDSRVAAASAGQQWGRHLAAAVDNTNGPVGTVLGVLRGLGFDPRLAPDAPEVAPAALGEDDPAAREGHPGRGVVVTSEVHLHSCPFLELVGRNPDAMCGLHAGVIRGALEQGGAPAGAAVLEPFGAPTACVVRLSLPRTSSGPDRS